MADYGIKISRPGYDVKSTGILNQVFNSEKNTLKLDIEGFFSSTASGARNVDVNHGYSYAPGYLAWYEINSSGKWFPVYTKDYETGKDGLVWVWADTTKVRFEINTNASATVKVYYVVLADVSL